MKISRVKSENRISAEQGNSRSLKITMLDTDEILVPLSELSKKLPYYSKIKPQLSEPSVVDMEAGVYSYTIADKLIEEAEEKPNKRPRKPRRKTGRRKEKQEEQGNQSQTSQQSQSR